MLTRRILSSSISYRKFISPTNSKCIGYLCQNKVFTNHPRLIMNRKNEASIRYKSTEPTSVVLDLLEFNFNDPEVKTTDIINALTKLVQLCEQKAHSPEKIVCEGFLNNLCDLINTKVDNFTLTETIELMELLKKLDVSSSSKTILGLLSHVDKLLNTASLGDCNRIMKIITDIPSVSSAQAMKSRLIKKFIFKISTEFERNNFDFLVEAFKFACLNVQEKEILKVIIDALETNEFDSQSPHSIVSLIKCLNSMKSYQKEFDKILTKAQNACIANIERIDKEDILNIIQEAALKVKDRSLNQFYNKTLFDKAIHKLISSECSLEEGRDFLESLFHCRHKSQELVDYMSGQFYVEREIDGKFIKDSIIFKMLQGLAELKHKPFCWETFVDTLMTNHVLRHSPETLVYRAYHLACLDCYKPEILQKVFEKDLNFKHKPTFHSLFLYLYQKLKTLPNYNGPLPLQSQIESFEYLRRNFMDYPFYTSLKEALGGIEYVKTNVHTKLYHQIEHVIAFQPDGSPIAINNIEKEENIGKADKRIEYLEDLNIPENSQVIAIVRTPSYWYFRNTDEMLGTYSTYIETLECLSCRAIPMRISKWRSLPRDSRTSFLMDLIKNKLEAKQRKEEVAH